MGGRSLIAAALVLIWCVLRGKPVFGADGTLGPGLAVGLLFGGEFLLLFWGLGLTTASRGVIFLYLAPFVVALGGHFALCERLTARRLGGLLAAFSGLVLGFSDKLSLPSTEALLGDAFCVGAAILWGVTLLVIKGSVLASAAAE